MAAKTANWTKAQKRHFLHYPRPEERETQVKTIGGTARPITELADWMTTRLSA